jgi:glycosyltransferase involved in cell wall biosynthesis
MAKVSIVIPSYNHSQFLVERLESINNQSFTDWEAIIIDDKSTDNSVEIIKNFIRDNPDFKVKDFIVNEINSGSGYNSWQKGIELADSEYIWIAETDDYSDTSFLSELVTVLEANKNCALVFCATNYVENGQIIYTSANRTNDLNVDENNYKIIKSDVLLNRMPFNPYITNGSSVVFRKPNIKIPQDIFKHRQSSDLFLWTFLLQNSAFGFLNQKLNFFRRHENSTTTKISNNKQSVATYIEFSFYLKYFNYSHKNIKFIEHYFNHYIWNNKREIFSVLLFKDNQQLKKQYFTKLITLLIKKIFHAK